MDSEDMNSIFEQIKNIRKPNVKLTKENQENEKDDLKDVLSGVTEEIQRVLKENNFTQEDLCRITNMSQSNISKIQNGKIVPRIETLQKIANATHTRLIISFENIEGEE